MTDTPSTPPALHNKVAGLSVGTWLAVTAGAVGVAFWMRSRNTAPIPTVAAANPAGFLDNTQPGAGNLGIGYAASNPTSGQPVGGAAPAPATNEDWGVLAQRVLFGKGYDPAVVDSAIRHYLNGDPLSTQAQALVSTALTSAGPTPQAVPPPPPGSVDPTGGPVTMPGNPSILPATREAWVTKDAGQLAADKAAMDHAQASYNEADAQNYQAGREAWFAQYVTSQDAYLNDQRNLAAAVSNPTG